MYPDKHGKYLLAATYVARFPCQQAPEAATLNPVAMRAPQAA